jgi:hypothetical protein
MLSADKTCSQCQQISEAIAIGRKYKKGQEMSFKGNQIAPKKDMKVP